MDSLIRIALCAVFGALGVLVQLLLLSKKRKKQSLKRAAQIRQEASTANEVERARAVMDDLGGSGSGENDNIGLETVSLDDIEDIDDPDEELDDL